MNLHHKPELYNRHTYAHLHSVSVNVLTYLHLEMCDKLKVKI